MNFKYSLITICALSILWAQAGTAPSKQRSVSPTSERSITPASPYSLPDIPSTPQDQYSFRPIKPAKDSGNYIGTLLEKREEYRQQKDTSLTEEYTLWTLAEAARAGDINTVKKLLKDPLFQQATIESMGALARAQSLSRPGQKNHKKITTLLQNKLTDLQKKLAKQQKSSSESLPKQSPAL